MKRLIICCDGTWQSLTNTCPTNVVKMAQIIKPIAEDGTPQLIYYQAGLGTEHGELDKFTGGIFGAGIDTAIQNAYLFLCLNYEPGDELYFFGFSRGAYTVRSLAGFIYCSGLLQRQHLRQIPQAYELYRNRTVGPKDSPAIAFRNQYGENVPIKLLACWDTVGSFGVPTLVPFVSDWINAKYKFHTTELNRRIEHALHAIAIDERRKVFDVTPMELSGGATTTLNQMWFPGTHGCVGGGESKTSGLSDAALNWMLDAIDKLSLGLEFVDQPETIAAGGIKPDYAIAFDSKIDWYMALGGIIDRSVCSPNTGLNHGNDDKGNDDKAVFDHNIHLSAKQRWALTQSPLYRPKSLKPYQPWFDAFTA